MIPPNERKKSMFLVELWRESSSDGELGSWRGIIKFIAHDDERYVTRLADITTFIERCIENKTPAAGDSAVVGHDADAPPLR